LSAEDDKFYEHGGINWTGVIRAVITNLTNMSKAQGASTITMQVARNFYLSSEKTYTRKFYELLPTFKIEATLTKNEILDLYMNQIYLGHRSYGFASASRTYFGKLLADITPAEAAMLAGVLVCPWRAAPRAARPCPASRARQAPSRLNPSASVGRARDRQLYVLGRMKRLGYLTEDEFASAVHQPIVLKSGLGSPAGGYA